MNTPAISQAQPDQIWINDACSNTDVTYLTDSFEFSLLTLTGRHFNEGPFEMAHRCHLFASGRSGRECPSWSFRQTSKSTRGTPGTQPGTSSIANGGRLYVLWFAPGARFTKMISRSRSTSEWKHRSIFPPDRWKRAFVYTCPMSWTMKSTTSLESLLNMPCHSLSTTRCVK